MNKKAKRLPAEYHVDSESECLYRYISSETERFILHCHDYYELFLAINDEVEHIVNGTHQILAPGTLMFIRPDDEHIYRYTKNGEFRMINLSFTSSTILLLFEYLGDGFLSEKLLKNKMPPYVVLQSGEIQRLYTKLSDLNAIEFEDKKKLKMHIRKLLCEVFIKYFGDFGEVKNTVPFWLENMYEKMQKSENFIAGISRMPEISGMTREYIARSLKKYYGVTPSEFVNSLRLNYCANLLLNSNMTVTEVCFESGFSNMAWFYTNFNKVYGISPKEFRNKYSYL